MHEHPSHGLSRQAACSLSTKLYEEPKMKKNDLYKELEKQYFSDDMQEQAEIALLPKLLQGVSLFVDVGASIGQYSYHAGRILNDSRIVAIEADPVRYDKLKDLASQWQVLLGNHYEVHHAAVSNETGNIDFYVTGESLCGGLHKYWKPVDRDLESRVSWTTVSVPAVTLDSLFPSEFPSLVKIDVEGAEYRVLEGAKNLMSKGTKFLVEIHPWGDETYGKKPSDVFKILTASGYQFRRTHTHWLFEKRGRVNLFHWIRARIVGFILDHEGIKRMAKWLAFKIKPISR
jgi:FkbM family methyltransferase